MRRAPYAFTLMVICLVLAAGLALLRLRPKEPEPLQPPSPLVVSPLAQPSRPPGYTAPEPVRAEWKRGDRDPATGLPVPPPFRMEGFFPSPPPPGFKNWKEAAKEGHNPLLWERGLSPQEYERQRLIIKANLQKAKQYEESAVGREEKRRDPQRPAGFQGGYVIPR